MTTKKLAKVSRPGSLETEMSHSDQKEKQRSGCISSVGAREGLVDQVAHPAEQKSPGLLPYTMAEELTSPLSFALYTLAEEPTCCAEEATPFPVRRSKPPVSRG